VRHGESRKSGHASTRANRKDASRHDKTTKATRARTQAHGKTPERREGQDTGRNRRLENAHDPRHSSGTLGSLKDHKPVVISKDGELFQRRYYRRITTEIPTWYWYDTPLEPRDPVLSRLDTIPVCNGDSDDCQVPSKKIPDDKPPPPIPDDEKPPPGTTATKGGQETGKPPRVCFVIIRYTDKQMAAMPGDAATNEDISKSAEKAGAKPEDTGVVTGHDDPARGEKPDPNNKSPPDHTLEDALADLAKGDDGNKDPKRCCSKILILGHGNMEDGSLQLPYTQDFNGPVDHGDRLGGGGLGSPDGKKAFKRVTDALKKALCEEKPKDLDGRPTAQVALHSCWSGKTGAGRKGPGGVAQEVSKAGIDTTSHSGVCNFTSGGENNDPVSPENATGSKDVNFHDGVPK
jgi:hypothetical protein